MPTEAGKLLDESRVLFPGAPRDKLARVSIAVARIMRQDNVEGAEILPGHVESQSYLHYHAPEIRLAPGADLLVDFGRELHGELVIQSGYMAHRDGQLQITLGESAAEALGVPDPDHSIRRELRAIPMLGRVTVGPSAFRFARLENPATAAETVILCGVYATAIFRDWEYAGRFACDDKLLNRIWEVGAYTVHLNCQEYIYDGVKRDRLVWIGDMFPEMMTSLAVFREDGLIQKSLDFVRDRTDDSQWMNSMSSYSLWWILCQYYLYGWRGNRDYCLEQKDYFLILLRRLLGCVDPLSGTECMPETRFLEWSTAHDPVAIRAGLQGLLMWALTAAAELCRSFGAEEEYSQTMAVLGKMRNAPILPCHNRKAAAAMQLLGNPGRSQPGVYDVLRDDPTGDLSTFYGYFVLLAHADYGHMGVALDMIRQYWGGMLALGATTFWEHFELAWGENAFGIDQLPVPGKRSVHGDFGRDCYQGLRCSLCHGWAAGPTAFLSSRVLGVRPAAPGFSGVRITPDLAGLKWAAGTIPTPEGCIELSVRAVGSKTQIRYKLPGGCHISN